MFSELIHTNVKLTSYVLGLDGQKGEHGEQGNYTLLFSMVHF